MKNQNKNILANVMKKVAGKSVDTQVNSRCMYIYHQPKLPEGIRKTTK